MENINIPINPERRDPLYGRSKADIGLSKVPNMSYNEVETSILANVKNTVDEGVAYNFSRYATSENHIISNIIKLKPNSSRAKVNFSLGTWTENSEFISRDTATLELWSNKTNVSYNLFISEPYPKVYYPEGEINKTSPLSSSKIIIKEFESGGWLVSIDIMDESIDALWINVLDSKNVDIQNPLEDLYESEKFGRVLEFYCDKSIISSDISISSKDINASSLTHDIPVKTDSIDPDDYYNTHLNTHSITNIDISDKIGTENLVKDKTLISIPIKTDENSSKSDQLIPISVNRLNHQIKFRLTGKSLHSSQEESWKSAQSDQSNMKSFLDTDPEATNYFPISISELTHDIDISSGIGMYKGSIPESGSEGGDGYNKYSFTSDGRVNYVTFQDTSTGLNEYYNFDTKLKSWKIISEKLEVHDGCKSLSTKSGDLTDLNMIVHGVDHDMKIEVVNSLYRTNRGSATDENNLLNDDRKLTAGISNLTWIEVPNLPNEKRKNSYATGNMRINTFEKDKYQCLDLTIHGLDHNISFESYRIEGDSLMGPDKSEIDKSDKYRPNSNGRDIDCNISLDTFTGRIQKVKMNVIDSRYSDCARGLAIRTNNNFMPYDKVTDDGSFGDYIPNMPNQDEILDIYPTINGIPFTGDFRHRVKYPPEMERDHISKIHDARNITISALHKDSDRVNSGEHKWEVLSTIRKAAYSREDNILSPVSEIIDSYDLDSDKYVKNGYGLVRLAISDETKLEGSKSSYQKISDYLDKLGSDDNVISVRVFKKVIKELIGS